MASPNIKHSPTTIKKTYGKIWSRMYIVAVESILGIEVVYILLY